MVGAGGIGFDVSEFLVTAESPTLNLKEWQAEWGAADPQEARGALTTPLPAPPAREVYLLQRSKGAQGWRLGKTSGWVHRASLRAKGVQQLSSVNYERIDDDGFAHQLRAGPVRLPHPRGRQCGDLRRPGVGATSKTACAARVLSRISSAGQRCRLSSTPSARSAKARNWLPGCSPDWPPPRSASWRPSLARRAWHLPHQQPHPPRQHHRVCRHASWSAVSRAIPPLYRPTPFAAGHAKPA